MFGNGERGSREQLEHRKDGIRSLKEKRKEEEGRGSIVSLKEALYWFKIHVSSIHEERTDINHVPP